MKTGVEGQSWTIYSSEVNMSGSFSMGQLCVLTDFSRSR